MREKIMKVTILVGVSGSGKSTWAVSRKDKDTIICSADNWFNRTGEYIFDPSQLKRAHGECVKEYLEGINTFGYKHIIVDNTNTTLVEISPYIAIAQAFDVGDINIKVFNVDIEVALQRNIHKVPEMGLRAQGHRLINTLKEWPMFWPKYEIHNE